MNLDTSLHQRRRVLSRDELADIPWLALLQPGERERAVRELRVSDAAPGDYVCRIGRPVTYWFGVIEGLLKMSSDSADGQTMTFTGVPPGGWFGEGTALKRETYRYNIQALRRSLVAGLPVDTFHWLLDHSIGFNRFVMSQLNERLGQFIAAREIDRMNNPDLRVARSLASLFNPVLYPGVGQVLRITQQELAYLVDMGLCSRREADDWIAKGWVQVNGRVATLGLQVAPSDRVTVDRQAQGQQANRVTILLNKPLGIVSGQAEDGHAPAISLIQPASRWRDDNARFFFHPSQLRGLAPAGRLDIDSTGLLVLTQDGRVARQLIGEDAGMEKEYLVRVAWTGVDNPAAAISAAATHAPLRPTLRVPSAATPLGLIDDADPVTRDVQSVFPRERLEQLRHGLSLDGQPLKPARVDWQNPEQLRFVLTEGKKRQIRRMCELVGLKVVGLKRVRIGRVMLGKLPLGQWRYLAPHERF